MRKTFISIMLIFIACSTVFAQNNNSWQDRKNEISFSYSALSIPTYAEALGAIFGATFSLGNSSYDNLFVIGPFNLEYYRRLNKTFAIGPSLTYEHWSGDIMGKSDGESVKTGNHHSDYITLMVGAKAYWFEKEHVSMYSKIAGGVTGYSNEATDFDGIVAFQVSPVGISFGGSSIRGFAEVGFGSQGMLIAGITHRF